jgi:hypothetical protein
MAAGVASAEGRKRPRSRLETRGPTGVQLLGLTTEPVPSPRLVLRAITRAVGIILVPPNRLSAIVSAAVNRCGSVPCHANVAPAIDRS